MEEHHYQIPVSFQQLIGGRFLPKCSVEASIIEHLRLIITTRFHECRFDPMFGCKIWEVDFEVPSNLNTWKDEIRQSLEDAIRAHEHRIEEITQFNVTVDSTTPRGRINQKLVVSLYATIKGTFEEFHFEETLYFSPVTLM